jgi:hypothetical protein
MSSKALLMSPSVCSDFKSSRVAMLGAMSEPTVTCADRFVIDKKVIAAMMSGNRKCFVFIVYEFDDLKI